MIHDTCQGGPELLSLLESDTLLTSHKRVKEGLSELSTLFRLLNAYNIVDKFLSIFLSLGAWTTILA